MSTVTVPCCDKRSGFGSSCGGSSFSGQGLGCGQSCGCCKNKCSCFGYWHCWKSGLRAVAVLAPAQASAAVQGLEAPSVQHAPLAENAVACHRGRLDAKDSSHVACPLLGAVGTNHTGPLEEPSRVASLQGGTMANEGLVACLLVGPTPLGHVVVEAEVLDLGQRNLVHCFLVQHCQQVCHRVPNRDRGLQIWTTARPSSHSSPSTRSIHPSGCPTDSSLPAQPTVCPSSYASVPFLEVLARSYPFPTPCLCQAYTHRPVACWCWEILLQRVQHCSCTASQRALSSLLCPQEWQYSSWQV
mmetsp:Transcript_91546/g.267898  ORF Transcript_91546/g.267898 Transcript_91546/m.267898 type:complete len:300 (-) Transcript_91546:1002-1901(-)